MASSNDTIQTSAPVHDVASLLHEIDRDKSAPSAITTRPGEFIRQFYEAWVANGGLEGGKNRNSIRRMRGTWLMGDASIKSLPQKLLGQVRLTRKDAASLIDLFLSRWQYVGVKPVDGPRTGDGYIPFPSNNPSELGKILVEAMFPQGSVPARDGLLLPSPPADESSSEVISSTEELLNIITESDAVITLTSINKTLKQIPTDAMFNFWNLLHSILTQKKSSCLLIWIIDCGTRLAEDRYSFLAYLNFELLAAQLRSFAVFDSEKDEKELGQLTKKLTIPDPKYRADRWRSLCERSAIVMQNLRLEEFDHLYTEEDKHTRDIRLKDSGVNAEHILPTTLPHTWGRLSQMRELYGRDFQDISEASLTIFYRNSGWDNHPQGQPNDLRYFGHAMLSRETKGSEPSNVRSLELGSPGEEYDEAARIVYTAVCHRLKRVQAMKTKRDPLVATAYLRKCGFNVLKMEDFVRMPRLPDNVEPV